MRVSFHAGSPGAIPPGYRIAAAILLRRIGRVIDNWVAGIIARREREVASAMFHGFTEGAPQDAGVPKSEIDAVPAQAADDIGR